MSMVLNVISPYNYPIIWNLLSEMESAIKELNGLGWFQMRATLLVALPLTGFPGFMQMQVFFGQILPHECENDTNKTGSIVSKYIQANSSDCGDCSMQTSYANDFGLLCDNKDSMPYLQRYFIYCISYTIIRYCCVFCKSYCRSHLGSLTF